MMRILTLAACVLLLSAPAAMAQSLGAFSVTSNGAEPTAFVPGQSTSIPVSVTVGCDIVVGAGAGGLSVDVATDLPETWGASTTSIAFSASPDCAEGQGAMTRSGSLTVNPTMDAMAVVAQSFAIKATSGSREASFTHPESWVAYVPGHTMQTNVTFPYNFTEADNGKLEFLLTVEITANGDTMFMFENVASRGTVSGLGSFFYMPSAGDMNRTKLIPVTWTPPAGAWVSDNITFLSYSHCPGNAPCQPDVHKTENRTITWRIDNGLAAAGGHGDDKKDTPGVGGLLLVGLVAAALVARRR